DQSLKLDWIYLFYVIDNFLILRRCVQLPFKGLCLRSVYARICGVHTHRVLVTADLNIVIQALERLRNRRKQLIVFYGVCAFELQKRTFVLQAFSELCVERLYILTSLLVV